MASYGAPLLPRWLAAQLSLQSFLILVLVTSSCVGVGLIPGALAVAARIDRDGAEAARGERSGSAAPCVSRYGSAYEGRCPRCYRFVRVAIGEEGKSARIWRAK